MQDKNRKDAGAKKTPAKIVPVQTPTGSKVNFHSTDAPRRRRKQRKTMLPVDDD